MDGTPIVIMIINEHQPNGFSLKETIHKKPVNHQIPQKIHSSITHFHRYLLKPACNYSVTQYFIYFMYTRFPFESFFTNNTPFFHPIFSQYRNQ